LQSDCNAGARLVTIVQAWHPTARSAHHLTGQRDTTRQDRSATSRRAAGQALYRRLPTAAAHMPNDPRRTIGAPERSTPAMTTIDVLTAARAEALFTSDLSAAEQPTLTQLTAVIRRALRDHGGTRGCAGEVAASYGDYPEIAAPRMRWARQAVEAAYSTRRR